LTHDPVDAVEVVTRWIAENAHRLTTVDPSAPLADLEPLPDIVGDATIVGLGRSTHGAHELSTLTHRVVRFLVERLGFRSLALEVDWATGVPIDEYVRTGTGDPGALLGGAAPPHRTGELVDVLRWMRADNEQHPTDSLRFVGVDISDVDAQAHDPMTRMSYVESCLARNLIWWHEHTGHKVIYWSGSHAAVGDTRTVSFPPAPPKTSRNAGSYLREHFGSRYLSVGLNFHHGSVPDPVPAPTPGRADSVLGSTGLAAYLLDLRAVQPGPVRAWLHAPATLRLIGPTYDPDNDANHHMSGGSLSDWFDLIIHYREVTPTRPIA
jgi:erythromycin esterase